MTQEDTRRLNWAIRGDVGAGVLSEVLRNDADSSHSKNGVNPVRELHDRRLGNWLGELLSDLRELVLVHADIRLTSSLCQAISPGYERSAERVDVPPEKRGRHRLRQR